jgi:hypothetical protein
MSGGRSDLVTPLEFTLQRVWCGELGPPSTLTRELQQTQRRVA